MNKLYFTLLLLGLLAFCPLPAQEFQFLLSDELSSRQISDIYQDKDGIIWIGTENGLNRYDGSKVTKYYHDESDEHSIAHNSIRGISEDAEGNLLVGSYLGLQRYDRQLDRFTPLEKNRRGENRRESVDGTCLLPDGQLCDFGDHAWRVYVSRDSIETDTLSWDITGRGVSQVMYDKYNTVWALTKYVGVYRLEGNHGVKVCDYTNSEFQVYNLSICDGLLYMMSVDNDIYRWDYNHDRFVKVNERKISQAVVRYIMWLGDDQLLICTDGEGFKLLNVSTGQVSDYVVNIPSIPSHLMKVHKVIRDREGNLWIALYQKGVAMVSFEKRNFGYIGHKSFLSNVIGSNSVSSITGDDNGGIWVGTDGNGLFHIDSTLVKSVHYPTTAEGGNMPAIIKAMHLDSDGRLWIGSYGEGCGYLTQQHGYQSFTNLLKRKGQPNRIVYGFAEDQEHRLWIASLGAGTFCYDLKRQLLIPELSFYDNVNKWQTALCYTPQQILYIGSFDGLYSIDLKHLDRAPEQLTHRTTVNDIYYSTRDNTLWVGDSDGLMSIAADGSITRYTPEMGLVSGSVNSIGQEADGSLWLASSQGLTHYFPQKGQSYRYTKDSQLQGDEFERTSSYTDPAGRLWFAGTDGITYFAPADVEPRRITRHIRITDFLLNNRSINTSTLSGNHPVITDDIYHATQFELAHTDNSFIIEFAAVEHNTPRHVQFQFSLNGGEWVTLPIGVHQALFQKLKPGSYSLRYRLADNLVDTDIQQVTIVIRDPWWATPWAFLGYLLLLALAGVFLYRLARERYINRRKEQKARHLQEINEAKLQFFVNISHEIKTPLSLILSPLQKLMKSDDDPKRQASYRLMHRNSRQLLQLVNQLMDIRKIDNGKLKLTFQQTEVISMIKDLSSFFDVIAEEKQISFSFTHPDIEQLRLWVDPSYFDKIMMNLLSNAFKYTPNQGHIQVAIALLNSGQQPMAQITVSDSGQGIKEDDLKHIFDRFYIGAEGNASGNSNGIGLHLTRSLVMLHHGTIEARNNATGTGATFVVCLPIGDSHLSPIDQIIQPTEVSQAEEVETEQTPAEVIEPEKVRSKSTYNLLIVDDDASVLSYLRQELATDFHITTCNNGNEALKLIYQKQPDAIISDVMMPEMDGISFCKKLKQNTSFNHIPIILLTAKSDEDTNVMALKYGADAYLTKPFYIEVVRRTALNLVQLRQQLSNVYSGKQDNEDKIAKIEIESPDEKLMNRIMRVVNKNISNPNLSIEMICEEVGISRAHLFRKLKELTNQSARDFIRNIRLKLAEDLLMQGNVTISEIAEKVGFSSISSFSAAFKDKYGLSPNQWRAAKAGNASDNEADEK